MNAFKRKSIYLAVVAGMGAVGVAGSAAAVTVSQTGTGEVLIYPYYTARNGTETYISVANTTASAKAVKVRFLEGKNSREVLDFNLYLSANDMWTAAVVTTTDGAKLITRDTSCSGMPAAVSGVRTSDFVNYAYGGVNTESTAGFIPDPTVDPTGDFETKTLDRTREGYFEIIEMGEILAGSALETAVTHGQSTGVPANCAVASALTAGAGGQAVSGGLNQLAQPTGGLIGTASLMNVAAGTDASFDPVPLSAFSDTPIWNLSGTILPDLTFASPKSSTVFKNGAPVTSSWVGSASAADSVTAVLMHDRVMNDFVLDAATLSGTDWVVTMPTKRHYVAVDLNGSVAPAVDYAPIRPFTKDFYTGGACEAITLTYFNREEKTPTGSVSSVSPLPPGVVGDALCWESTVLTFNNSAVLGSSNQVNKTIEAGYENGWMRMDLATGHQMIDPAATYTYNGLPTVGFMVQDFVNGNVGGVLSNYGGAFIHKYRTNISGGAITSATGE